MSDNLTETYTDDFLSKLVSNNLQTYKDFADDDLLRYKADCQNSSLRLLVNYVTRDMNLDMPLTLKNDLLVLDGLYFTTRYPGDDTVQLTVGDILKYLSVLETCKHYVESVIIEQEQP